MCLRPLHLRFLVALLLLGVLVGFPVHAGEVLPPTRTDPWIDDDAAEIRKRIDEADEKLAAGDLKAACRVWQELLDLDTPKLLSTSRNTFASVAEWARMRLVAAPEEIRAAYRETVGPDAKRAFDAAMIAQDEPALERVWRRFPLSPYGARAAFVIADLARRRGELDQAAARLAGIAKLWPPVVDGAAIDPASGVDAAAFAGQRSFVAEWASRSESPDEWAMPGGRAARNRVAPIEGTSFELVGWLPFDDAPEDRGPSRGAARITPREATIADGEVRVTGRDRIYRIDLKTGERRADWTREDHLFKFSDDPMGPLDEKLERPHPVVQAGRTAIVIHDFETEDAPNLVTGLDLNRDAAQRWVRGGGRDYEGAPYNDEDPDLADVRFCGSPVIWGNAAYVVGVERGAKIQVRLYAIDLRPGSEGRFLWPPRDIGLGTALGAMTSVDATEQTRPVEAGTPAVADGVLYFSTNLGATVALDAMSGEILWVHRYERSGSERVLGDRDRPASAWRTRHPVVAGDAVFFTPTDCDRLLIYGRRIDPASGGVLQSDLIRRAAPGADTAYTDLLGVRDGVVFLSGARTDPDGSPIQARKAWPTGPRDDREDVWSGDPHEDFASGRGLVTKTHVLLPTDKALYAFPIAGTGESDARTKQAAIEGISARFDGKPRRVFGNLVATRDRLVSVTEDGIFLFRPVSTSGGGRTK